MYEMYGMDGYVFYGQWIILLQTEAIKQIINDMKEILEFKDKSRQQTQFPDLHNHCEYVQNIIAAKNHDATTLFVKAFYARGNNTHFPEIIIDLVASFMLR